MFNPINFVFGFIYPLLTLTVHLSHGDRTSEDGELSVFGSSQAIIGVQGGVVILPCHVRPQYNVETLTVEWSRPDLKPDPSDRLSRVEYVHVYRRGQEELDMKIQSYFRRTSLFPDDLKRGNISLKISNVTLEDAGRYKCFIPKLRGPVKESIVSLVVEPEPDTVQTPTTETLLEDDFSDSDRRTETADEDNGGRTHLAAVVAVVSCLALILVGGLFTYFLKRRRQRQNLPHRDTTKQPL